MPRRRSCARRAIAEKLSNAVEPSNTASTVTVPGRIGSVGRWSNGLPISMRPLCGLRRMRREAGCDDAVHLERVGAAEPLVAADDRARQGDDDVHPQPQLDRAQRARVGTGELQPHEGEQAERGGPVAQRPGIAAAVRAGEPAGAAGTPCAPARPLARSVRSPVRPPPARPTSARRTRRAAGCRPAVPNIAAIATHAANSRPAAASTHRVAGASTAVVTHCGSARPGLSGSNRGRRHARATTPNVKVSAHAAPMRA